MKKSHSRLLFFLSFICFCQIASAQNATAPNAYLTNFVTPAPNAASLGKYADYPVSYYTGVPQISVPIYNLKDGGISLPISLSYHASGIHVSELASWIGLGWALNAGGVIIRTVRGNPDEGVGNPSGTGVNGYYSSNGLSNLPLLPYSVNGQSSDPSNFFYGQITPAIMGGHTDCEPDLYTFNFNGHVGKFVFDENRTVRMLEDNDLVVKVSYSSTGVARSPASANFSAWEIITPDGIEYYFGENNTYEQTFPSSTVSGSDIYNGYAPSSWYLTRIVNPNTKDTATFNYVPETYAYKDLGPESTYYTNGNPCDNSTINGGTENPGIHNLITTTIYGQRLSSIVTKNYTINFIAKNARADLLNMSGSSTVAPNSFSLDSIKINSNTNNVCLKQFTLNHTYFQSTTATSVGITNNLNYYGTSNADATDTKRLKLASVQEFSGDGTLNKPPYVFTYQESYLNYPGFQLPRRLSYDQDHWGFSNNAAGSNNNYFTPAVFNTTACGSFSSAGAYRHPVWPDMLAFTLTNIQDPLGVTTTFTYGPHSASNGMDPEVNPMVSDTLVGGLRILQIKTQDNVTSNVQVRSFSYSGGSIFNIPQYLYQLANEYYSYQLATGGLETQQGGYVGQFGFINVPVFVKQSQGIVPMQDEQGNYVTYQYVKESFGAEGENGYKKYQFSAYLSPYDITSRLGVGLYQEQNYIDGVYGIYGSGHFNDIAPETLPYAGYTASANCYPFTPQQVDLTGGRLLEEDTYDASNNHLESTTYAYSTTYHENYQIRGLKVYNYLPGAASYPASSGLNALSFYKLRTGISHLTSTTRKTFTGTSFVSETTNYGYESPNHTLQTSDTTVNSNGDVLINKNYYSFDYTDGSGANIMAKMKARNLLEPVSTYSWKNNTLIAGKYIQYQDFANSSQDTLINPVNINALETAIPLTPTQASLSQVWTPTQVNILPNAYLKPRVNFNYDGVTAKPVNEQLTGGSNISYQWGYKNTYPVAKVLNAASTGVKEYYYEGFEDNATAVTGTGHTGTKYYSGATYLVNWTLPNARSYRICYWYLSNNVWTYQSEQPYTGPSMTLSATGAVAYDDIRIHPSDAQMTTYTYDLVGNMTSSTDAKNETTYYDYDALQRLSDIKDQYGNIIKSYCYNYAGQTYGCNVGGVNSFAQPYVQMTIGGSYITADPNGDPITNNTYTFKTFSDVACTIPYTLQTAITINFQVNSTTYYNASGETIVTNTPLIINIGAGANQATTGSILVNGCTGTSEKGNCTTATVVLQSGTGYLLGTSAN
ncbi:YD repeat-containing protein [Mucilaginibacter frigoritolerans]|uniref:YD repeat-containing protein n=1 Tax=Mucilaginibacter frigoritolerans TaxID=652788 RepID=A0A562TM62_9SPHI|nr:hypothetical protein [Mucilaginibacter frigoritolerans]TWI93940.1 YD repeat-containing protein [Mucilaginibacter frigoritolerans]